MKAKRWLLSAGMTCLLVAAGCSSGRSDPVTGAEGDGAASSAANCTGVDLKATDTGITKDTITIETVADTGSATLPGLANGSLEAMRAWAKLVNDKGGLACRKVEVRTFDSKLNPNESRSGMVDSCQNAFSMVGDVMLAVADVTPIAECVDAQGAATGLPQVAAVAASALVACNKTTYTTLGAGFACPPAQGERTFTVSTATGDYVRSLVGGDGHGVHVLGYSTPGILELTMPGIQELRHQGLSGKVVGARGSDPQSAYTPYVQEIKQSGAQFVYNVATFPSFLLLQSEAKAQGVTVPHWICAGSCYDPAYAKAAGDLAKGVQILTATLPFEEASTNQEMRTLTENVQIHNTFSMGAWLSARLFQAAVEAVVKKDGPNALTRKSVLDALQNLRDFDAGGLIGPVTPADHSASNCIIVLTVNGDGKFERVTPKEAGKFQCGKLERLTFDPVAAYSAG